MKQLFTLCIVFACLNSYAQQDQAKKKKDIPKVVDVKKQVPKVIWVKTTAPKTAPAPGAKTKPRGSKKAVVVDTTHHVQ